MKKKIAAIDIGTTKVCTIMGILDSTSGLRVLGVGVAPSHGIEKALVADATLAKESIKQSIRKAEVMAGYKLDSAYIGVFTTAEFQQMGYKMVIWPVSSLRIANKAQAELYAAIRRDGGTQAMLERMQTRAELYEAIGYQDYEALDASIVTTVIPQGMPQRP